MPSKWPLDSVPVELSGLSDVGATTPTNRNVLVADGSQFTSRALVEADISDLGSYLTAESDPVFLASAAAGIVAGDITNWDAAFSWGDHAGLYASAAHNHSGVYEPADATIVKDADFASDGILKRTSAGVYGIVTDNSANWDTAFGWGNHASAGYLTSVLAANIGSGAAADGYVLTADGAGNAAWEAVVGGGGASQLSDLTDVNTSTPTNRNVLVADGVDWESRALTEADISDLGSYALASHNHTGVYEPADATILKDADIGVNVQAYAANLTTWAGLAPSANAQSLVTAASYAAMRALLDLEAGTDFYSKSAADAAFAAASHSHATSDITSGTFADARIAASNVTQHQASLSIAETQIPDGSVLARLASNEVITGEWSVPSVPRNKTASYTLVLGDAGQTVRYTGSTASQTFTIPANASVAFPIGTMIALENDGTVSISIAITTDTLSWAKDNTTGTRTLAAGGMAVIKKVTSTRWKIAGSALLT